MLRSGWAWSTGNTVLFKLVLCGFIKNRGVLRVKMCAIQVDVPRFLTQKFDFNSLSAILWRKSTIKFLFRMSYKLVTFFIQEHVYSCIIYRQYTLYICPVRFTDFTDLPGKLYPYTIYMGRPVKINLTINCWKGTIFPLPNFDKLP